MGLVFGEHHGPAGQFYQPGHDLGRDVVMVRSPRAVSLGRRQLATSRTRRYRVHRVTCGQLS